MKSGGTPQVQHTTRYMPTAKMKLHPSNPRFIKDRDFDILCQSIQRHQLHSVVQQTPELGKIRSSHPATFPVGLPAKYIEAMTDQRDIVGESFLGSGTTMVAAHQLNRRCYGMEIDPKYCQVIVDRMLKLDPTLEIKRNGKPYKTNGD